MFAGFFFPLGQFVTILSEIDNLTNRRIGPRAYFHQVQSMLAGRGKSIAQGQDPKAPSIRTNDKDFPRANAVIYAKIILANTNTPFEFRGYREKGSSRQGR